MSILITAIALMLFSVAEVRVIQCFLRVEYQIPNRLAIRIDDCCMNLVLFLPWLATGIR
ncbi:hypothetical protein ACIGG6_18090 [Vreelandella lionensis]|uniref:Uncharacterized protein n=1 Tax=Vreelandella lionensis TaxID=1144478 RepID=A0ABW8C088_9GAMM